MYGIYYSKQFVTKLQLKNDKTKLRRLATISPVTLCIVCRVEREVTARLRAAQDEAYAESLAADQEKERRRAADRAAQELRDHEDAQRRQQEERHKQDVGRTHCTHAQRLPH